MAQRVTHSPADITRRVLIDIGVGGDPPSTPWPIYATSEPDLPDNLITVFDVIGSSDGRSMIDGEVLSHFGIQIRVRSTTHQIGWQKADEIQTALAKEIYQRTISIEGNTYYVHCFARIQDVLAIGFDLPNRRSFFVVNANVSLRQL